MTFAEQTHNLKRELQIEFHPLIRQAFGINTNIYHGAPLPAPRPPPASCTAAAYACATCLSHDEIAMSNICMRHLLLVCHLGCARLSGAAQQEGAICVFRVRASSTIYACSASVLSLHVQACTHTCTEHGLPMLSSQKKSFYTYLHTPFITRKCSPRSL